MSEQVVLITGALTGIGRATAIAFAREGAKIVVSGRHDKEGQKLVTELGGLVLVSRVTREVRSSVAISPDPGDDPFCLCAEQGKADFILTLNPKDFPQKQLRARVLSPVDFL
jgi:NAD(P)-dependent dehydrogenase (short-subunit alcohol dehydrogenase family)